MPPDAPPKLVRKMFALLGDARVTARKARLNLYRWALHDPSIMSTNDLNEREVETVTNLLESWQRDGELELRAREHVGDYW